jgi:hypothetical protein
VLALGYDELATGSVLVPRIQGVWQPFRFPGLEPGHLTVSHYLAKFYEDKFTFFFDRVLPGEYWICFWDDGSPDGTGQAIPLITPMKIVVEDVEDQVIEIPIEKMGQLVGHVFDSQTKRPIAGAEVLIEENLLRRSVHTNREGYYRCELPKGKYQILVYSPDGDLKVTIEDIQVTKAEVTKVDVSLIEAN